MEKRKHIEEKEKELAKSTTKVSCEKWREEKTCDLLIKNKGQQRRKKEELKKKEDETKEKSESATLAFNAW